MTSIFPSSSLFSSFFSLFSISVSPHILCVCLSPEGSRATRLINNYRVHKIGKEAKKKKNTLSFDVQHERNQNYKETELYKEERKLAHSFLNPLLLFSAVFVFLIFFILLPPLFLLGGVLSPQFQFCLYKHLKLFLWLQEEINHFTKLQTTICLSIDVLPIFHLIYFLSCAWMLIIMLLLTAFLLCEVQINARSIVPPPTTTTRCVPVVI